jgi:hypothetical protein
MMKQEFSVVGCELFVHAASNEDGLQVMDGLLLRKLMVKAAKQV